VSGAAVPLSAARARTGPSGTCFAGARICCSSISSTASSAPRISSGIAAVSGRFRQNRLGISEVIAATLSRAGLKIAAK
jgi:hypothetical protein